MNTQSTKLSTVLLAVSFAFGLGANANAQSDQMASLELSRQGRTGQVELKIQSKGHRYAMLFAGRSLDKPIRTSIGNYYLDMRSQVYLGLVPLSDTGSASIKLTIPGPMEVGLQSVLVDAKFSSFRFSAYNRVTLKKSPRGRSMGATFFAPQTGSGIAQISVEASQQEKVAVYQDTIINPLRRPWWNGPWLEAFLTQNLLVDCYTVYVDGIPVGTVGPCP